jgi:uncharacterized protein (TIRG00374 family)
MVFEKIISIFQKRTGKYSEDIKMMHSTFEKTIEPKGVAMMSFLSAFAWFFECLGMYLVVIGFGESLSITRSTFIFSFGSLTGAVSMIPGGLGVAEATIYGLLNLFGISQTVAVGITLIVRLGTLWYGAIMGLVVYLVFRKSIMKNKSIKDK